MHHKTLFFSVAAFALVLGACAPVSPLVPAATLPPENSPVVVEVVAAATVVEATPTMAPPTAPPSAVAPTLAPTSTPLSTATNTPEPTSAPTRTATQLPTSTSTPAAETSLIFTDDYEANCILQTEDNAEHAHGCEGGEYFILNKVADKDWGVLYPDEYSDFVLETQARVASGSGVTMYGLWLRSAKNGKAYVLSFYQQGGYTLEVSEGDEWRTVIPLTKTDIVKGGNETNRIKVIAQGNQMALYLNDQFLDTVTDSTVDRGRIGYLMWSKEPSVKVAFDNLTVAKINRPLPLPAPKARPPTATPMPTIPGGMGGLIVNNYYGKEVNFDIAGKLYKVPANGSTIIYLPPGKHNWSADIPGLGRAGGTAEIELGRYSSQYFAD